MKAVDLFSGCGGFSYGFQQAGFEVVVGVDNNEHALKTFELNHNNSKGFNLDLHLDSAIDELVNYLYKNNHTIDVIIAGPPCQGFSLTGTRNAHDKRNTLFYAIFKLAEKINPKAIVIENVPGIITLYKGKAKNEILRLAEESGYSCKHQLMFAPDYGVPQIRKRVFFVALKKELGEFSFPAPLLHESEYITCSDAISDLPSLVGDFGGDELAYTSQPKSDYQKKMRESSTKILNHVGTRHTEHVISVISQVPEGGNHKDLPPGVGDSRKFNEAWTRYHSQKPSKTIDTGHRNHFHYKYHRVPTMRENARLQSFPDVFQFVGTKTEQNKQVGNAVPPLLGKVIAEQLKGCISD
ncbi:MAG: DNA cytosine methyltransferase [Pseudomonadota bacterium]|nr:DNA cytosine methyltransferase [Pseudomonadota bacterium]